MEQQITIVSADQAKALIARLYLAEAHPAQAQRLGEIRLHPHQLSAVARLLDAIRDFGGAILADEVGMGKTFVALAVARCFPRTLIVGPAVLRDMWTDQAERARMRLPFLSFESLSRGRSEVEAFDLVVVDEAHHVRNPFTIRYRVLSQMLRRSSVLMLSATPVHNSRRDILALLALFLGSRAQSLTAGELARCVVRRRIESVGFNVGFPRSNALVWKEIEDRSDIPRQLLDLPPPVPPRNGGDGGMLIARALLRQWCSSDSALKSAVRRRLARAMALTAALECGEYPKANELSAWTFAEDSLQLAFPSLVATGSGDCAELLVAIRRHEAALRRILESLEADQHRDAQRGEILKQIRRAHSPAPIAAFSQYIETAHALFRELRSERGVAVLTARGARVAGGAITRREALSRFAPHATGSRPPRDIERIDLLLTTDLLSEGVNLQDAGVVVHLDLPWTAARLEQRVGRLRRMGSKHRSIVAYGIHPDNAAEALIGLERTIRRKIDEAEQSIGVSRALLPGELSESGSPSPHDPLTVEEEIRRILTRWMRGEPVKAESRALTVAAVECDTAGFIALCANGSRNVLIGCSGTTVTDSRDEILDLLLRVGANRRKPVDQAVADAQRRLRSWFFAQNALALTRDEASVTAQARRKILRRISAITENARPHERQRLLDVARRAREKVLGILGVAAESELLALISSRLADEDWLRLIVHTVGRPGGAADNDEHADSARIIALLLLEPSPAKEP